MRSKERSEWMKTCVRLKQQEDMNEKTVDNFVSSMKLEPEILRALQNERHSCASERRKFLNSLRCSVMEIVNGLKDIKSTVNGLQEGRRIDVDSFRTKLMALADGIRSCKKDCPLEQLTRERLELDRDLHEFSTRLIKYEARNNSTGSVVAPRKSSKTSSNFHEGQDYREIRDFDALVAKTGHTENWTDEDHLFFLKARKTCPNVQSMVAVIKKKFPDISAERIINHEAWYKTYTDLREAHRKAIEDWRRNKKLERTHNLEIAMKANDDKKVIDDHGENKSDGGTIDEETISEKDATKFNGRSATAMDSLRNRKKESIARWRIDKENAKSVKNERAKSETELRKIVEEKRRLARARRIKETVSAWREKKMENLTTRSAPTSVTDLDRTIDKSDGTKLVKLFRLQDEEFLKRRKTLLASKQPKSNIGNRQNVRRNSVGSSTLSKPTKVWLEKCKRQETDGSGVSQQLLYVKDIPKLATCHRKNLESA